MLLKTSDVAKELSVAKKTVVKLIRTGKLKGVRLGRQWTRAEQYTPHTARAKSQRTLPTPMTPLTGFSLGIRRATTPPIRSHSTNRPAKRSQSQILKRPIEIGTESDRRRNG